MASIIQQTTREGSIADDVWAMFMNFQITIGIDIPTPMNVYFLRSLFMYNRWCYSRLFHFYLVLQILYVVAYLHSWISCFWLMISFWTLLSLISICVSLYSLGFLVGCIATCCKITLSNNSIFKSTWLRWHN